MPDSASERVPAMDDSNGRYVTGWTFCKYERCPACGSRSVMDRLWEYDRKAIDAHRSVFEMWQVHFFCQDCRKTWHGE